MNTPQLGLTETHAEFVASVDVEGADPVTITDYAHTGKALNVTRLTAYWHFARGRTSGWRLSEVRARGSLLKKNGLPGQVPAETIWTPQGRFASAPLDQAPAWVREWLETIELPTLPGEDR